MDMLRMVKIEDYRSFTSQSADFEEVTCLVGPNEGGKTNLLRAISHLAGENQLVPFEPSELRMGAPGYPHGEVRLTYTVAITEQLLGRHSETLEELIGKRMFLTKKGRPGIAPVWDSRLESTRSSVPSIVRIENKSKFLKALRSQYDEKWVRQASRRGWFRKGPPVDLRRRPFRALIREGVIHPLDEDDNVEFLSTVVQETILSNIRVFQYTYGEGDFLPESVDIEGFLSDPQACRTVANMFRIAGWKQSDFKGNLTDQNDTVYGQLLEQVELAINKLIKKNWTTHDQLTLELDHKGSYFTIRLKEPGSKTPPEYRSDGLKWYLTFLINFRARREDKRSFIVLIDEPGLHLHPRGQKDTLRELELLATRLGNQVIYTTHQTFMIDKNRPESVRILSRRSDKGRTRRGDPFYGTSVSRVDHKKRFVLTDLLLREALGFGVSDISPINEKNVLVEGAFDRSILQIGDGWWRVLDMNETSIISCWGASDIAKHANLYKANELKVVCVYDHDNAGHAAYRSNNCVAEKEKVLVSAYSDSSENCQTIEDLIPDTEFAAAFRKWVRKWGLNAEVPVRPRMVPIRRLIEGERKADMKHSLEDMMVSEVANAGRDRIADFKGLKEMLVDLHKRLS